ncbi:MAG: hypothetical protein KF763_20660 [Cyclobacteriaceae bacterium]|nr:hypothetical protein [Cyclobacteriaceae bacterium]
MKNLLSVMLSCIVFIATAQDTSVSESVELKSKRGINILPEAGEWALGVGASPFLSYTGNLLNGNTANTSPSFQFTNNPSNLIAVFGKYMVDANTAYRARFNATINSQIDKAVVVQNELNPDALFPAFTEDWRTTNTKTIVLAAGYEKRRGKSRVQGIYGGELVFALTGNTQKYEYGNQISADFNTVTTNNFGGNILLGSAAATVQRKTEEKFGNVFTAGVRGFIGVEYFIGPKVSLGAEFGYSFLFRTATRGLVTAERWNPLTNAVLETKIDVNNNGYFTFLGTSLDNLNGSVNLLFYF